MTSCAQAQDTAPAQCIVSFGEICMENLPEGTLVHRRATPGEAKQLIDRARRENGLFCASGMDLLARYGADERDSHRALCAALKEHFDIAMSLHDFIAQCPGHPSFANPLESAQLKPGDQMLVVSSGYILHNSDEGFTFELDHSSIAFHVIECLSSSGSAI